MPSLRKISWTIAAMTLVGATAMAQKPIVYPAKSQSAAQQQKDDGECYTWAKGNTGIDPAVVAAAPAPSAPPPTAGAGGARVGGAAKGAIVGGAISGGDDSAAKGGAAIGAMAGGAKARQQKQAQAQAAQQQSAQQKQQAMTTFYKGYGACMEGRGYTVK
jgi:hypothetical protein